MRKGFVLCVVLTLVASLALVVGCVSHERNHDGIVVISREEGSGTRGAFVELFDITKIDESGQEYDATAVTADICNSTAVGLTSVESNPVAITYVSLGSIRDTVKPLRIDGVEPTIQNVQNGSYSVHRNFNLVTKIPYEEMSVLEKDFVRFVLSKEGQQIVQDCSYVNVKSNADTFESDNPSGVISIVGSSSVAPVVEKLAEAYEKSVPGAHVEVQVSDSTTGINSVADGVANIGMSSRELKESESYLVSTPIALDAIVLIVNNENPIEDLSKDQVKDIFMGTVDTWTEFGQS